MTGLPGKRNDCSANWSARPVPTFDPDTLLAWFDRHSRHDLPWQQPRTPYRVWVSEIMLQQTRVQTVIPYFERFLQRFPDVAALATAPLDAVLALWSGLGYYARARHLHRAAGVIVNDHGGRFPDTLDGWLALPGIGRSTAGAILAQAFDQRQPILDGNVRRVLARYHAVSGWPGEKAVEARLWQLAEAATPDRRVADYTQAIMDLGATVCTRTPLCERCPLAGDCRAHALGRVTDYPGRRTRKPLPVKRTAMLILKDTKGAILLERRPPSGIWGGLWSLPECGIHASVPRHCRERLGLEVTGLRAGATFRHTFSHYHLDIVPVWGQITLSDSVHDQGHHLLSPPDAVLGGLPAPVRRLIRDAA